MMALDYSAKCAPREHLAGMVLTNGILPHSSVMELIRQRDLPVITTRADVSTAATAIARMTIKIEVGDRDKIGLIQRIISENVNVEEIIKKVVPPRPTHEQLPLNLSSEPPSDLEPISADQST
jgi:BioD-like phosphotransacetylase family protein